MREDWVEVELGEILKVSSGKGLTSNKMSGNGFPVYGGNGITGYHSDYLFDEPKLIIGRVGVRCGVTHITKPKSWITDNALVVEFKIPEIDINFMQFKLHFEDLNKLSNSTAQPVISGSKIYSYSIFLPPIPIQRSIVSKIENLFTSLDKGIADLEKAQEQLKVYRQAVLKKAFEGGLTNQNIKNGELPKGWKKLTLGDIAIRNSQKALPREMPNAKFIGMDCIEANTLKPFKFYDFREFKSAGNVFKINQVLYGRMRPYLNKVYRAEVDGTCSGEFIVLDCKDGFNPDLLKYILHHRDFVSFANHKTSGDRPRISFEEIADYPVNVCKPEEQIKIVREIESRLSVCDKVEQSIFESLEKSKALRQSILKKAFEGKLLSEGEIAKCKQAADYEPASELLKKIKAEKKKK